MASLTDIYGNIKQECYIDEAGVYKDSERVALDNSVNSGYTRWNGDRSVERIGLSDSLVTKPLVFVGAVPKGNASSVLYATIAALVGEGAEIISATVDKGIIAGNENIDFEDLQKFDGVCMVSVEYEITAVNTVYRAVDVEPPCWILDTGFWVADCEWTTTGIWKA